MLRRLFLDASPATDTGSAPATRRARIPAPLAIAVVLAVTVGLSAPRTVAAQTAEPVAGGLENPWGMAFLPDFVRDGRLLVTERPGRLRIVDTRSGQVGAPVEGVPSVVARGQGGLLDVAVHPQFASNRLVYLAYTEPDASRSDVNGTAVARGRLEGNRLVDVQVVFRQSPKVAGHHHFGSRLVWGRDGRLFVTLGDRFTRRDDAQTLDNHLGKIVRIEADGKVPADNPLIDRPGARPEVWSYGHRNVQGAAIHPVTGELWAHEHGAQGGDELNLVARGGNHGWPVITTAKEYGSGATIGEGTARPDVVAPVTHWVPRSVAPSGMVFVTGDRYPGWQGALLIGTLRGEALLKLTLDGSRVVSEQRVLQGQGRIRDVRQGPDGFVYLLTDARDGRLLRLQPGVGR
jgi:glucose/arabinose dehydrogenase